MNKHTSSIHRDVTNFPFPIFKSKVQMINYLVKKFGNEGSTIVKLVTLFFLADVYAIRKYGDIITDDTYFAMNNRPVASDIDNILEQQNNFLDEHQLTYLKQYLERKNVAQNKSNTWDLVISKEEVDDLYLSERIEEVLDYIFEKFGEKSENELIELSHEFNAYKKHKDALKKEKRCEMDIQDFIEDDALLSDINSRDIAYTKKEYGLE